MLAAVRNALSEDTSENFDDDHDSTEGDQYLEANGTPGLILYQTPTATKASYWKRHLGWKATARCSHCKKLKSFFRAPTRRQVSVGLSSSSKEGDALILAPRAPNQLIPSVDSMEKMRAHGPFESRKWKPEVEYVVEDDQRERNDWNLLAAKDTELVFA